MEVGSIEASLVLRLHPQEPDWRLGHGGCPGTDVVLVLGSVGKLEVHFIFFAHAETISLLAGLPGLGR